VNASFICYIFIAFTELNAFPNASQSLWEALYAFECSGGIQKNKIREIIMQTIPIDPQAIQLIPLADLDQLLSTFSTILLGLLIPSFFLGISAFLFAHLYVSYQNKKNAEEDH
jgi:hypothetical protein